MIIAIFTFINYDLWFSIFLKCFLRLLIMIRKSYRLIPIFIKSLLLHQILIKCGKQFLIYFFYKTAIFDCWIFIKRHLWFLVLIKKAIKCFLWEPIYKKCCLQFSKCVFTKGIFLLRFLLNDCCCFYFYKFSLVVSRFYKILTMVFEKKKKYIYIKYFLWIFISTKCFLWQSIAIKCDLQHRNYFF